MVLRGAFNRHYKETYNAQTVLKFGLLMTDMPDYVSCKSEINIFKIALVIIENVRFALLYVLSIH